MVRPSRLWFIAVLVIVLAGCSGVPAAPAAPAAPATTAPAVPETAPTAAPVEAKQVTIRYATWEWEEPGLKEYWTELTNAFMAEYHNIKIEPYRIPWTGYYDKVTTEIQSGSAADVMMLTFDRLSQFKAMGAIIPLDDYLAKTDILQRFYDEQKTSMVVDGKTYGLIASMGNWQIFANTTAFKDAGISFPTTPDEFLDAAVKLTKKRADGTIERYGYAMTTQSKDGGFYTDLFFWVNGFGGNFANAGKPTANDPKTVEAIKFLKKLFDSGAMPRGVGFGTYQQYFPEGKLVMLHGGQYNWTFIKGQKPEILNDCGFFAAPFPNATAPGGVRHLLTISKDSKNPDAAFKLLEFFARTQWQKKWLVDSMNIPGQKGLADEETMKSMPFMKLFLDAQPYAKPVAPPGLEVYAAEFQKIVEDAVEEILYKDAQVEPTMDKLQKDLELFVASKKS